MATAESAKRTVPKATYVPLVIPRQSIPFDGYAVEKYGALRSLMLSPGEVDEALRNATGTIISKPEQVGLLRQFEGAPMVAQLPARSAVAAVPSQELSNFMQAVTAYRQKQLTQAPPAPAAPTAQVMSLRGSFVSDRSV